MIDSDDVSFASVRAQWLDSPKQVASELLEAAEHPDLLDGVTPRRALIAASSVLFYQVGHAEGIAALRRSVQGSEPGADDGARMALAVGLAEGGDPAEAEAVAREAIGAEHRGSVSDVTIRIGMADGFAESGHFDLAERWAKSAVEAATARPIGRNKQIAITLAEAGNRRILKTVGPARDAGLDSVRPIAAQQAAALLPADPPPWPALVGGRLVWWPEPEYLRLIRHLPGVAGFLGSPWRDHTARVEAAMRLAEPSSAAPAALVAATFDGGFGFVHFIDRTDLDPREPTTMTAFTEDAARYEVLVRGGQAPVRWPPRPRKRCWCGSGRRYQDCCRIP
jgi:SEC-C motif-containing protein